MIQVPPTLTPETIPQYVAMVHEKRSMLDILLNIEIELYVKRLIFFGTYVVLWYKKSVSKKQRGLI